MDNKIQWGRLRSEYIHSEVSYRELAKKYNVSIQSIARRGRMDGWVQLREEYRNLVDKKLIQKTADLKVNKEVARIGRIRDSADKLLEKLETAIEQLDNYVITCTTKTKKRKFGHDANGNRTETEIAKEHETRQYKKGDIDRTGLRQLTAALKDIRDISLVAELTDEDETGVILVPPVKDDEDA